MVPENRKARWGTQATFSRSSQGSTSRTSTPSTLTLPSVTSSRRGMRLTRVVLPEPVEPMKAVVRPGRRTRSMSSSTGASAPG